ncbi:uncharacterized protein DMENIID0001_014990 [Sergentomyia squamirostris]
MDLILDEYCLLDIFSYLELIELENLKLVSKEFYRMVHRIICTYTTKLDISKDNVNSVPIAEKICSKFGRFVKILRVVTQAGQQENIKEILAVIFRKCPNIRYFYFEEIPETYSSFLSDLNEYVTTRHSNVHMIKSIALIDCNLCDEDDQVLGWMESATGLEILDLSLNYDITGKCLKFFRNLKGINLSLCSRLRRNYFIDFCKNNKTLTSLEIEISSSNCILNQKCINSIVENLQNLEHISISCEDFPKSTRLSALADLPKLKNLELNFCNLLAIPLLDRLARINRLEEFKWIVNTTGPDWSLEKVELIISRISPTTIKFRGLKKYVFYSMSSLESVPFTDQHLQQATMNNLEEISIPNTSVTDEGIYQFILRNSSLKTVDLTECQYITDEFAKKIIPHLQTEFKSLRIYALYTNMTEEHRNILLRK